MTEVRLEDGGVVSRVSALDGLRGIAVMMVFLYHSAQPLVSGLLLQSGVDLFFVLSGFLITSILLRTRERSNYFRNFYGRRSVRIFPLYYLVLSIALVMSWITVRLGINEQLGLPGAENMLANQAWAWTYQINNLIAFQGPMAFNGLHHLWSLAIEEQFYLVWPLLLWKLPRNRVLGVCIAVATTSMLLRCIAYPLWGRDFAYHFTLTRLDGLAIGAVGAVIVATPALHERFRPLVAWVGRHWWLVFALILMPEPVALYAGLTVLSVGYLLLVLAARDGLLTDRMSRWLNGRVLQELGKYSYALYVFSIPAMRFVDKAMPSSHGLIPIKVIVSFGITWILARLSWRFWEAPWLRLKSRFAY